MPVSRCAMMTHFVRGRPSAYHHKGPTHRDGQLRLTFVLSGLSDRRHAARKVTAPLPPAVQAISWFLLQLDLNTFLPGLAAAAAARPGGGAAVPLANES